MTWVGNFYRSSVGKKAVMAVTGLILFGFVFVHMLGNLKLYLGPEHLNEYAESLRTMFGPIVPREGALWVARVILLVAVILHIHAAYGVTMMSRAARPTDYHHREYVKGTYAARTMRWGGVIVLLFIIYHLLHFTFGWNKVHPTFEHGDVYHNVITGFQVWWVSAFYIIANLALGLHLYHGVWAMFSSVGVTHQRFDNWRRGFATAFALIVTIGNISFPLMVLTGLVGLQR